MKTATHLVTAASAAVLLLGVSACGGSDGGEIESGGAEGGVTTTAVETTAAAASEPVEAEAAPTTGGTEETAETNDGPYGGQGAGPVPADTVIDYQGSGEYAVFQSPTGNIGCSIGAFLRCETLGESPQAFAINDHGVQITPPTEQGPYLWAVDTVQGPGIEPQVLEYGSSIKFNRFECMSARDGMICTDKFTNRGAKIAQEGVEEI